MRAGTVGALVAACASSPLVRPDDATFARATGRFDAAAAVTGAAPAPDEALLLQAEALREYRFQLRPPTAASYAGQAFAALLDFSPLAVLAAGGIGDLRLRAPDGAAQLYEALLARYPRSRLRPLALYRLGWVYRSTSVGGWPRDSDGAFDAVAREAAGTPLGRLAIDARRVPYKTQGAAVAWSILPGAGQIYTGETANGVVRLSIAVALAVATLAPLYVMARDERVTWWGIAIPVVGIVGLQVSYTTAYQDAQRAAIEFNERREAAFEAAHPDAP